MGTKASSEGKGLDPRPLNEVLKREYFTLEKVIPELAEDKVFCNYDLASGYWHIPLDEDSSYMMTFATQSGCLLTCGDFSEVAHAGTGWTEWRVLCRG